MLLAEEEKQVLKNIAYSTQSKAEGKRPTSVEDTEGWYYIEYLDDVVMLRDVKKIVRSLEEKQLVTLFTHPEDDKIKLTESGFALFQKLDNLSASN